MCQFYSPIITRKLEVLDCADNNDNHEDVIGKYKLKDDKLENRDFVRLELTPKDGNIFNHKISNWQYKEDEDKTLPEWYQRNLVAIKKKCYARLKKIFKKQFLIGGEYEVIDRNVRFVKDATIKVLKGTVQEVWDGTVQEVRGGTVQKSSGSATITFFDKYAYNQLKVSGKNNVIIKRFLDKVKVDVK